MGNGQGGRGPLWLFRNHPRWAQNPGESAQQTLGLCELTGWARLAGGGTGLGPEKGKALPHNPLQNLRSLEPAIKACGICPRVSNTRISPLPAAQKVNYRSPPRPVTFPTVWQRGFKTRDLSIILSSIGCLDAGDVSKGNALKDLKT